MVDHSIHITEVVDIQILFEFLHKTYDLLIISKMGTTKVGFEFRKQENVRWRTVWEWEWWSSNENPYLPTLATATWALSGLQRERYPESTDTACLSFGQHFDLFLILILMRSTNH